jgi:hypothetical protein
MNYNEYDLLELFESFPSVLFDGDNICTYTHQNEQGFTLKMFLNPSQENCSLKLLCKNMKYPIVDIDLYKVETIICKENKIIIHQKNEIKDLVVHFKPTYRIVTEDHLPL